MLKFYMKKKGNPDNEPIEIFTHQYITTDKEAWEYLVNQGDVDMIVQSVADHKAVIEDCGGVEDEDSIAHLRRYEITAEELYSMPDHWATIESCSGGCPEWCKGTPEEVDADLLSEALSIMDYADGATYWVEDEND